MIKNINIIHVYLDEQKVGSMALTPDYLCAFEYCKEFLDSGTSISPFFLPLRQGVFLPTRDPFNGIFGVFNDSLPDGWGMLLTERYLKSKNINIAELSILQRLALLGHSGMGALRYEPDYASKDFECHTDLISLSKEIESILNNEDTLSLEELYRNGGSSGGARPKVLITIEDKPWLVKFRASSDPENIGQMEYQYAQIARKCGIEMPETRLFENRFFGVQRFDIQNGRRIHMLTASGLLHASHRLPSLDYLDLLKATFLLTKDINEVYKLFRIMVFNIVTHNRDDHAKNFSFLLLDGKWKLSPAYDLVYSHGFNGWHTTTVNGSGKPTLADITEVAKRSGLDARIAYYIVEEINDNSLEIKKINICK